jgi:MoxR-like ATPase
MATQNLFNDVTIKELKGILRNWRNYEGTQGKGMELCPFLWGAPGGGKTDLFQQLAEEWDARFMSFLTSTMDPTDVVGVPFPDKERGCTVFMPPEHFLELTEDAKDKGPVIALFDDLPASIEQVFNALLGVFHGRRIAGNKIRDNVLLCATGNRAEDKAGAQEIGTALNNRFIHFNIKLNNEDWEEWAFDNDVDPTVLSYIKARPQQLDKFAEALKSGEKAYATPRSVARASLVQRALGVDHPQLMAALSANCGQAWAADYHAYMRNAEQLVPASEIFKDAANCKLPDKSEVDVLYATITSLVYATKQKPTVEKCRAVCTYAMRIGHPDLGLVLAQDLVKQVVSKADDPTFRTKVAGDPIFNKIKERFGKWMMAYN